MNEVLEDSRDTVRDIRYSTTMKNLYMSSKEESLQVYLNCEEEDVDIDVSSFSEVVYSRKWAEGPDGHGVLGVNGILILKK